MKYFADFRTTKEMVAKKKMEVARQVVEPPFYDSRESKASAPNDKA